MSVAEQFIAIAHRVVWCTLSTVDRRNRPRSRIVHPVWEVREGSLHGLVATRPTPLKLAHLAHAPHVSCTYWDPAHDVAIAECAARWLDEADRQAAWERIARAPAPAGYDPATIWPDGPTSPEFAVIDLEPWRVSAASAAALARGERAAVWRAAPLTQAARV
jgi:hypothetical protein